MINALKSGTRQIPLWVWVYGAITMAGSTVGILSGFGRFELFFGEAIG